MRDKLIGKLRCFQSSILVFFMIHGGIFGTGVNLLVKVAKEDMWIATIIGIIVGFIPFYLFISLSSKYPDKNIFEIIESICGKFISKFIILFIVLFVATFTLFAYWNLTNLISSQYLYQTPQLFVYIIFAIPIIYILSKGLKITLRSITIIFFMTAILYIVTFIGLVPQAKFSNIFPILKDGIIPPLKAGLGYIAYVITPLFFINVIPVHYYEDKNDYKKYMIISYIISSLAVFAIPFLVMSVFGVELAKLYQYPEFQILRRVSLGGFIERVESTLSIQWIFELFVLITIGMYFIKQGTYHIIHIKNKRIKLGLNGIFIIGAILFSLNFFRNNTVANEFSINVYPFICLGFFIFFFIFYLITTIKKKQ